MRKELKEYIDSLVTKHPVVLFMKGTKERPQCGFSKQVAEVLNNLVHDYLAVDVLANAELREGIKIYSDWPTIPQLYVKGEFLGGCDIALDLYRKNELQERLGLSRAWDVPLVKIADAALSALKDAQKDCAEGEHIRLTISANFAHGLTFDSKNDGDLVIQHEDVEILIDPYSAVRAPGLFIDYVQENLDAGFAFTNPNEPPEVKEVSAEELKSWCDQEKDFLLLDVRPKSEADQARIIFAKSFLDMSQAELDQLKKDQVIVFHCHHGGRSRRMAESFRFKGFTNLYNLTGGIDAWSKKIDRSIPTYGG
ncbi:MAG TPA: Grx4 family monothiol glutaredoxin [Myxococcota bacterium]|nr:Grx4 family monothiol glutaredoxin [Myxococcota bacterium]